MFENVESKRISDKWMSDNFRVLKQLEETF